MNYFLGIQPNDQTNYKIRKVVGELGRVFQGQDIDVRWSKPETFHCSVVYLGKSLNPAKKFFLDLKLKKTNYRKFSISFERAVVGISRRYKELVYLGIDKGGDELREIVLDLRERLKISDSNLFIPHVTLGRISKELSEQEFRNLKMDVRKMNKSLKVDEIEFEVDRISLIRSDLDSHEIISSYNLT